MGQNIKEQLNNPSGKVPADDKKTYNLLFSAICDEYGLETAVPQMAANRMASTLMRIHYCEEKLKEYGLFIIEDKQVQKMNPIAYYLRDLESEFMKYIRLLKPVKTTELTPKTFLDLIDNGSKKTRPKKNTK